MRLIILQSCRDFESGVEFNTKDDLLKVVYRFYEELNFTIKVMESNKIRI